MARITSTLINPVLTLNLLALTSCGLLPEEGAADVEAVVETQEDELRQASPAENIAIPSLIKVDRIGGVTARCTTIGAAAMARLRYRATRGVRTDSVVLTFLTQNGYISVGHERNGKRLGAHIIDGFTKKEIGSDGFARAGRERDAAYLFAELASTGVMKKLPEALSCLGKAPTGELVRGGETYQFYGWCDFAYDLVDAAFTVTTAAVTAACCTTGVGCVACTVGGGILVQTVTKTTAAGQAQDCRDQNEEYRRMQEELNEQRERRQMREDMIEMQERIAELERKVREAKEEEEKKKGEEEEKAQMGT